MFQCIRHLHKHTQLAILALLPTLYPNIFAVSLYGPYDVKLDISMRGVHFMVADFIGLGRFNFEWHYQNKIDNIGILVLYGDYKLY